MALAAGALSHRALTSFSVELTSAPATGGEGPYTYQWYRSETADFTPGGGNIMAGKTALSFTDETVLPGKTYYYEVVVTDTGDSNNTANSAEMEVEVVADVQNINRFDQDPVQGMLDLRFNGNTLSAQVDNGETSELRASQAVMFTQDANGVPTVTACTANTDQVAGFINYDVKSQAFVAGDMIEISQDNNVMYLVATAAIARGAKVMIVPAVTGGVVTATSGKPICGIALDVASGSGQLIRVKILAPTIITA